MRAEILFPEVCNLYGDLQNVYYLRRPAAPRWRSWKRTSEAVPAFWTER